MKQILIIAVVLFSLAAQAQKVKIETDKFTGSRRVETQTGNMFYSFSKPAIELRLRAVDTTYFISYIGYGAFMSVINDKDYLMFLMKDGKTIKVYSTGEQLYTVSSGLYGGVNKHFDYQYSIGRDDIQDLINGEVVSIRSTSGGEYHDIDLKEKQGRTIHDVAADFNNALSNNPVTRK